MVLALESWYFISIKKSMNKSKFEYWQPCTICSNARVLQFHCIPFHADIEAFTVFLNRYSSPKIYIIYQVPLGTKPRSYQIAKGNRHLEPLTSCIPYVLSKNGILCPFYMYYRRNGSSQFQTPIFKPISIHQYRYQLARMLESLTWCPYQHGRWEKRRLAHLFNSTYFHIA